MTLKLSTKKRVRSTAIMRIVWCLIILGTGAVPAMACINDTAVGRAEEQFRSRYDSPAPDPSRNRDRFGTHLPAITAIAAMAIGASMVVGTIVLTIRIGKND